MFKAILWQDYFTAVAVVLCIYYFVIVIVFFSKDMMKWFNGPIENDSKISSNSRQFASTDLMGSISNAIVRKLPVKETLIQTDEVRVESTSDSQLVAIRAESPAADLYDDLDELFAIMALRTMPKIAYAKGLKALIAKYPFVTDASMRFEVSSYIHKYFKDTPDLNFDLDEIESWWPNQRGN